MPPYIIFPDRTLVALAAAQPQSQAALLQVRGVGPAKLGAYGERLLQLLASGAVSEAEKSLPNQQGSSLGS
jgi:ATP-dependent DNA helicase RecQ